MPTTGRLARERRTMERMVAIRCRDRHGTAEPCADCRAFLEYAAKRLEKCPYGEEKPTCTKCPIHCYKPAPRELAREIMRYAGPRMLLRHPYLALRHVLDGRRPVPPHPMDAHARRRAADPRGA